jgi:hypothetical protein
MLTASMAARTILSFVFVFAGVSKLAAPSGQILGAIRLYGVTNRYAAYGIRFLLPILEMAIAAALILGDNLFATSMITVLLLCVFTLVTAQAVQRGHTFHCSCFGSSRRRPFGYGLVLRNFGLLALASCVGAASAGAPVLTSRVAFQYEPWAVTFPAHLLPYLGLLMLFACSLLLLEHGGGVLQPTRRIMTGVMP